MKCVFKKDNWSREGLTHAFSIRFAPMPEFNQQEEFIENVPTPIMRDGYAYVSLVTKEKVTPNVKITTRCAFEDLAAPLFVMPKELIEKDGKLFYRDYLEVVLWRNGINVWNLWTAEDGEVKIRNLMRLSLPVQTGEIHDFGLEIQKDRFIINLDDQKVDIYCDDIYDSFHLGITGCEGPCRFYEMGIEKM